MMADFEKPGLSPAICGGGAIGRYIELSLGAQCAIAVDNRERRVVCTNMPLDAPINYYAAMDRLSQWLGIPQGARGSLRAAPSAANGAPARRRIPRFSSARLRRSTNHRPSTGASSRRRSAASDSPQPVEFVLDPGTNLETERFSETSGAIRAAAVAARDVTFRVARGSRRERCTLPKFSANWNNATPPSARIRSWPTPRRCSVLRYGDCEGRARKLANAFRAKLLLLSGTASRRTLRRDRMILRSADA